MVSFRQEILSHAAQQRVYDKAARRERYLRERQLKGRRPAQFQNPEPKDSPRAPNAPPTTKPHTASTPVTPERVAALKVRLTQLKELLAQLVEQAKAKAGVEPTTKEATKKSAEDKQPAKEKTAAEKKEDAKAAKEQRDKEPPKPETASSVQAQIDSVRKQIEDMRAKIAAARKAAPNKKSPPDTKSTKEDDKTRPGNTPTATEGRHH